MDGMLREQLDLQEPDPIDSFVPSRVSANGDRDRGAAGVGQQHRALRPRMFRARWWSCFSAFVIACTLAVTAAGPVPIEEIKTGDQVWAVCAETGEWSLSTVLDTFERLYCGDMVTLELVIVDGAGPFSRETLRCTAEHPFLVIEGENLESRPEAHELPQSERDAAKVGRWTEARWLRLGDRFLTKTGYSATVAGLTIRLERVRVFNLHVEGEQTYAVGDAGVAVHNNCPQVAYNLWRRGRAPRDIARIEKPSGHLGDEWHATGHNGVALKLGGGIKDGHKGPLQFSRKTLHWLKKHGWKCDP